MRAVVCTRHGRRETPVVGEAPLPVTGDGGHATIAVAWSDDIFALPDTVDVPLAAAIGPFPLTARAALLAFVSHR